MPQPVKIIISALLIAYMIAVGFAIDTYAAEGIQGDIGTFYKLDDIPLTTYAITGGANNGNSVVIKSYSDDLDDFYAFCFRSSSSLNYYTAVVYSPPGGRALPVDVYGDTYTCMYSGSYPATDMSPMAYTTSFRYASQFSSWTGPAELDRAYFEFLTPLYTSPQLYLYPSWQDGVRDIAAYTSNLSSDLSPLDYTLPSGYALVIDMAGVPLSQRAVLLEMIDVGLAYDEHDWGTDVYMTSVLPTPGELVPNRPIYYNGVGRTNLLGEYRSFRWSLSGSVDSSFFALDYLVIANTPTLSYGLFDGVLSTVQDLTGFSVHVQASLCNPATSYLVPLTTTLTTSGIVSRFGLGQYYFAPPSPNSPDDTPSTVPELPSGDPYIPIPGGDTIPETTPTVNGWLSRISQQISDFFSGALTAITTLSNAGRDFAGYLSSLFGWLPSDIYTVLIAGIALLIIIGVVKHLL